MKLSPITVFLVLLGIFVAFCTFSHVKSRLKEAMTEQADEAAAEEEEEEDEEERGVEKCMSATGPVRSIFGCCADGTPKSDVEGKNCAAVVSCNFGTCDNSKVCKVDQLGSNCDSPSGKEFTCAGVQGPVRSMFGCCTDGSPMTDAAGTNCKAVVECNYGTCPNSSTCKVDSMGSNCSVYPPPLPQTCTTSVYGCCPDGTTTKNADGSNCYPSSTSTTTVTELNSKPPPTPVQPTDMYPGVTPYNTNTVLIPPPVGFTAKDSVKDSVKETAKEVAKETTTMSCPKPPPCPACDRCPEPEFDCKKVPNYERPDNERFVPQAVLTDFSSFGM